MRIIDGQFGEVIRYCKDGSKIFKRSSEMKVVMYACDVCEKAVKDKKEFANSIKIPGKDGKKKVVHMCEPCDSKFQNHMKSFFKG